jgi:CRP-like cAMP-binding protein
VKENTGLTDRKHKSVARVGIRTDITGQPVKNVPLLTIAAEEFGRLRQHMELVALDHRQILHEAGEKIRYAYFPNGGLASLVVITSDGRSVEIAMVGKEGIIGTPLAVGLGREPYRAIMQIPGTALRIRAEVLEKILPHVPDLQLITNRYILMRGLQVAQIAACNRLHEIEQRLARWLLMCQDRVEAKLLPVTHEFIAQMLGTGRPTVSLAAGILQRAGMIENLRGNVKITNRKNLEQAACECYRAMRQMGGRFNLNQHRNDNHQPGN